MSNISGIAQPAGKQQRRPAQQAGTDSARSV